MFQNFSFRVIVTYYKVTVLNIHFHVVAFAGIQPSLCDKGKKQTILTHIQFYTPWKRQKTFGFLMFSGGIEMEHRAKVGFKEEKVKLKKNYVRFVILLIAGKTYLNFA